MSGDPAPGEGEPGGSQPAEGARSIRVVKHSIVIAGHRTSVSLEEPFWRALKEIAATEETSLAGLVARVDEGRGEANLSSALRVFVLERAIGANPLPKGEGGCEAAG